MDRSLGSRGGRPAVCSLAAIRRMRYSAATTRSRAASSTLCANAGSACPTMSAVIGFDNWEIVAAATRPPLTTIDMNLSNLGQQAGQTLLSLIDGKAVEPGIRKLPCRLVVRQSCGGPSGWVRRKRSPLDNEGRTSTKNGRKRHETNDCRIGRNDAASIASIAAAHADSANIWVRADGSNFMPRIVDAFNKGHTDQIKLSIIPNAEIIPKYGAAAAGGTAPDALSLDLIYTPAFSAAGQLEDITDWAKSLPYFDQLSPAHVKTGTYKGRIYGLPYLRRQFGADLEQETVQTGRARSGEGTQDVGGDRGRRRQGQRARRRHQGLLLLGQLRRLQHLHLHAADLGLGRRHPVRGRLQGDARQPADARRHRPLPAHGQAEVCARRRGDRYGRQFLRRLCNRQDRHLAVRRFRHRRAQHTVSRTSITASPSCPARTAAGRPSPAATISSSRRARPSCRSSRNSSTSPIRWRARRCSPPTAACRCAAISPRTP